MALTDFGPNPDFLVRETRLEREDIYRRHILPPGMGKVEFEWEFDYLRHNIVAQFRSYVYKHPANITYEAAAPYHVPRSWWQAFKREVIYRNIVTTRIGRWLVSRFPVRVTKVDRTVRFEATAIFPDLRVEHCGKPFLIFQSCDIRPVR